MNDHKGWLCSGPFSTKAPTNENGKDPESVSAGSPAKRPIDFLIFVPAAWLSGTSFNSGSAWLSLLVLKADPLSWKSGCGRKRRKESEGCDREECLSVCRTEALCLCLNGCLCVLFRVYVCVACVWVVRAAVVPRAWMAPVRPLINEALCPSIPQPVTQRGCINLHRPLVRSGPVQDTHHCVYVCLCD